MMKVTIEYDGECRLDEFIGETKIMANETVMNSFKHKPVYELTLPKVVKAKVTIEEDDIHKYRVIEDVAIKIDGKIDQDTLKQKLYEAVTSELTHLNLK